MVSSHGNSHREIGEQRALFCFHIPLGCHPTTGVKYPGYLRSFTRECVPRLSATQTQCSRTKLWLFSLFIYIFLMKHFKSGIPLPLSKGGWDLISWFGFQGVILIQIEILFSSQSPPHPRYLSLRTREETSKWFSFSSDEQAAAANSKPSAVLLLRLSVDVGWRCLHRHGRR